MAHLDKTVGAEPSTVRLTLVFRDLKAFASEEVFKHKTADDCWLLIEGKVYDVTKYLDEHPGGSGTVAQLALTDLFSHPRKELLGL